MMKKVRLVLVLTACLASFSTIAQNTNSDKIKAAPRDVALYMAAVKSNADLADYMKRTPPKDNPLLLLSADVRQEFIDSLTFNENGITGYRYDGIERELDQAQIYKLLSLFGTQRTFKFLKKARASSTGITTMSCYGDAYDYSCEGGGAPGKDYPDYYCEAKGTCNNSLGRICTSNC